MNDMYGKGILKGLSVSLKRFAETYLDDLSWIGRRYRTEAGDVYTLSLNHGRLGLTFCTYPTALVTVQADGSFVCPMLWGTKGRMQRDGDRPVSALLLSQFGNESAAKREEGKGAPDAGR